jgi:hypothetical protein
MVKFIAKVLSKSWAYLGAPNGRGDVTVRVIDTAELAQERRRMQECRRYRTIYFSRGCRRRRSAGSDPAARAWQHKTYTTFDNHDIEPTRSKTDSSRHRRSASGMARFLSRPEVFAGRAATRRTFNAFLRVNYAHATIAGRDLVSVRVAAGHCTFERSPCLDRRSRYVA